MIEETNRRAGVFAHATDEANGTRWTIGNDHIYVELGWRAGGLLRLLSTGTSDGTTRWDGGSRPLIDLVIDGLPPIADWPVVDSAAEEDGAASRLRTTLGAPDGTRATVVVECRAGQEFFRQWVEIDTTIPHVLRTATPLHLNVASAEPVDLFTVAGVQQQGGWQPDAEGPYRSFRLESRQLDGSFAHESGPRSTWTETPWAVLAPASGQDRGLLLALDYGGQWELHAGATGAEAAMSLTPVGITPALQPRSIWRSASAFWGPFAGDLDDAAALLHRYVREVLTPPIPVDFPWVQYNTWFSHFCDFDAGALTEDLDVAADLGCEVFYVDAGWWAGNPRRNGFFSSGLGNWRENRDKFPAGIAAFADRVRAKGLHFGIWVEPERVDLRTATTGTWRTDWLVQHDGHYRGPEWPPDTDTAWLCFGSQATQDWAFDWISALVASLGVRWLKWDSNFWAVCNAPDHGHGVEDGEAAQLAGVYTVMDRLRARFPDLIIENCAGGGTRMDYALVQHTHCAWMDDASEPAHRTRFHTAGATYLLPPEQLNAWVTESYYENLLDQEIPEPVLRAMVRSRMIGALGFSCRLARWSEATRRVVAEEIALYKRVFRPLVRSGKVHHLLPQPDLQSPRQQSPVVWEAYQLTTRDRGSAVVLAFRNRAADEQLIIPLKGLDPDARYFVEGEGILHAIRSGDTLLEDGIAVRSTPLASALVTLRRIDDGEGVKS